MALGGRTRFLSPLARLPENLRGSDGESGSGSENTNALVLEMG